jgi:two-component system cell cycle sensor histidine kinase/response regulator CckA
VNRGATKRRVPRSTRRLPRRYERLETLVEITRELSQIQPLEALLAKIAEACGYLLDSDSVGIRVRRGEELVLAGASGDARRAMPTVRLKVGESLSGIVAATGQVLVVADAANDPRMTPAHREAFRRGGYRAFLGVPLSLGTQVLGVLSIRTRRARGFSPDDLVLATAFAAQAAIALENARLLDASTTRQDRLQALLEASRQLSKIQPVESLLNAIAQACGHLLSSESVGFWLVDGDELVVTGTWGDAHEIMVTPRLHLGESLSGRVAASGEALVVADLASDPRLLPAHRETSYRLGYRGMLVVPVKIGERVAGVLSIRTKRDSGFSSEDVALALAFASQAAVALENSRLYQETRRAYDELSTTQDQLTQARKMEAVGRLAGGVAHDFNNLLTVMIGRSQLLLRRLEAQDPVRPELELIQEAAGQAAELTRQLLAFSRKQVLRPTVLDLNSAVAHLGAMLKRLIGEDIVLVTELAPALGCVKADPGQIQQVVMNLTANARDAMPRGGRLTIETANVDLDATYARRHVGVPPGQYVMLAVTDTGLGMAPETQAHIFEPFFTTKGPGQGTGLGLATVYGVVKQSDGHIWVYSEPGRGTTFKIYLPRVNATVTPEETDPNGAPLSPGHETILLAEDAPAVRALARDVLRAQGYTVLEAQHGREALTIGEQHAGPIHLLLTDVVMPEMNGRELAERLASIRPTTPILYMSGYTDNVVVHHGVLDRSAVFLEKPFTPAALVCKVRQVLDTNGGHVAEALSISTTPA